MPARKNKTHESFDCLPMVGYYGGKYEKKDMIALICQADGQGIILFNTAEVYEPYTSEEWVDKAITPFRDKVENDFLGVAAVRLTHYEMEEFNASYAKIDLMGHRIDHI